MSEPDFDLKGKKDDHSDSDDDEHSSKSKGPKLPGCKIGKGKSGEPPEVSADVDIDDVIERPDLDISGVDNSDVKGPNVDISGPRVSEPDFDLKGKEDDHSDTDDDEHSSKSKGPKLPSCKIVKGRSGEPTEVSADVDTDADIERPDLDISGVDNSDVKGPDVEISGPRVNGPDFDLKGKKNDHSDTDDDEHSSKFKGPELPSCKIGKGRSGEPTEVSADVDTNADIERPDLDISGVDNSDVKGPNVDISGPRVSEPDFDLKGKKDDHSDTDDDEHSSKFKGPELPSCKIGKGRSGEPTEVSADVDTNADIERPDLDISGVDNSDVKGPDVDISGPRVSEPDFDLKGKEDDHSDSDDNEHSSKSKGPKLPSCKIGKGRSGEPTEVSADVDTNADIERTDLVISGVDNSDVKGPDVDISGPRVSEPDFDLKAKKDDHSDTDDDEHSSKFKSPKLPSCKIVKGRSGEPTEVSADVDTNAAIERPDLDISGVDNSDVKGPDVDISGPRVSEPDFDLKGKKDDHSDSDDNEHSSKSKGPKLPSCKIGKGKSGEPTEVSADVDTNADIERPDLDISGVDNSDVKSPNVDISGPRVSEPDFDLKGKKDDHSDTNDDEHSSKFKGPKLPSCKIGKGKSGEPTEVSADVDTDADIERPDLDISGVDSPDVKGPDVDITGPRVSEPDFDLKGKKEDHSDSDDEEHS